MRRLSLLSLSVALLVLPSLLMADEVDLAAPKDAMFYMQASGIKVIAATEKTEDTIFDVSFVEPCAIIMGSEGKGINPSVLKLVDHKAKLPMYGDIGSLNVSVACGAFLYEAVRQRL